ncbi:hypothetical protein NP233_g4654 [Leucocoprinus birnbaumii]|uniref:GST N-terminal domain-containing protein n=1 Tax=Leucocoprinus birnbaumii TaxID=56174 RepID=A0AAD5VUL9_9AGAR|nr:hypothetical protein NP233_g4654 [Leucocoprinus birnbaumii]
MIILYDLAGRDPNKCWSSNVWKARYVLNYKKLPYRTIYLGLEEVDGIIKEAGIPPSRLKPDGTPLHTVPSIIDDATGERVTDSYAIAEYLDKQYPDTPKAFPQGTEALQAAFYQQFNERNNAFFVLAIPHIANMFSKQASLEHFSRRIFAFSGKSPDQIRPVGEELEKLWEKAFGFFDELDGWYGKSSGAFLAGDAPSFGDFTVAAALKGMKIVFGEDEEHWVKMTKANNGRWSKLLNDLEIYASDEN